MNQLFNGPLDGEAYATNTQIGGETMRVLHAFSNRSSRVGIRRGRAAGATRLTVIMLLLMGASLAHATSYYVDKDGGGGSADGLSWATAWVRFADIQWGAGGVGAGDTLYISGGAVEKFYFERLVVGAGGTAAAPLVITKGDTAEHGGTVIIDGQHIRTSAIMIEQHDYITVRNLSLRRSLGEDGELHVRSSSGIVIEDCSIIVEKAHGAIFLNGYGVPCRNSVVRNCTITTPAGYCTGQTDGVYSQYNFNSLFEGNHIVIRNTNESPHCDAFQCYQETDVTIRNNYCEQDNQKAENAQGIFVSNSFGTTRIYNNVCVGPNTTSSLIKFRNTQGTTGIVRFYNNTVVGGQHTLIHTDVSDTVMKNNIFYITGLGSAGRPVVKCGDTVQLTRPQDWDNNLIFSENSDNLIYYRSSGRTWAQWQDLGAEANGMNVTPQLGADHSPRASSPVIDAGADLSAVGITLDFTGRSRPIGAGFDIGAFEYGSIEPPSLPAPSQLVVDPAE
jgi:hypothetical protein